MLENNIENASVDTLNLLDLVIVERRRFQEPFLNVSGFDAKLELVTYEMEKDLCETICEEYNTMDELRESEELVLMFNYLIEKGIHTVYEDDLLENIKMFDSVIRGLSYTIENELMSLFEEAEED